MSERLLKLDDLRTLNSPDHIANIFRILGYSTEVLSVNLADLDLSERNREAIDCAYSIAIQGNSDLQVLLFKFWPEQWDNFSVVSSKMRSIFAQLSRRNTEYLLLATPNFNQLMLVNGRKSFDEQMNIRVSIRKLLIDRTNPTPYDLDRLEAIAVKNQSPQALYLAQCEAFDVEKLTKTFYKGYKQLFDTVITTVKIHNQGAYFDDHDQLHQFCQRLLGRIMFLYFLQKKGFLAGDRRFLSVRYKALKTTPDQTNYYSQVLEPLFFETLNQARADLSHQWGPGKIPYLNGGLFDRDYGENIKTLTGLATPKEIILPNSLFDPAYSESILGFFNSYNFTVSENVAGDEDVAVDPEMLGKVFENMLAAEERGQSGTFYTPRGIVHFMCVEVLTRYLAEQTKIDRELVRKLVDDDPDAAEGSGQKWLSSTQVKALKQALVKVKVLDPAVGSGAFPLGMMQVILNVRQAIARREGMTVQRGSLAISQWKREIIANNLYGVDIKPEAIEIAKLRMWLSLVVDIPQIDDVEPLPNLDYKLMCGDSLISTIHGERLIPDPTKNQQGMLAVTPIQQAIQPLLDLQQRYFSAQAMDRASLREQILAAEKAVFQVAIADRKGFLEKKLKDLQKSINSLKKPTKVMLKEQAELEEKIADLAKFAKEVATGKRAINFFQYHLHFRDVFQDQGGFDIVIGNPPYVRQEAIKDLKPALSQEYECYTGVADLYVYFYEQGLRLLKNQGYLSYISSNKYFRAGYGEKLRQYLANNSKIEVLIDFGDAPVFEAIAYPSIILISKDEPKDHLARVLNWSGDQAVNQFVSVYQNHSFTIEQKGLNADGWRLESSQVLQLLDKLKNAGTPLGEYVDGRFYYGIKTGFNEAFVVDRETRDRLISEHPSSAEVLKPLIRGRDVKRWCVDYQDLWLIFTRRGIDIDKYPAIKKHLLKYKDRLTPGVKGGRKDGSYKWYEIQDNIAYWQEFETNKIIYPNICKQNIFAWDDSGYYANQKTFIIPKSSKYLLAVLNSSIMMWMFDKLLPKLVNGFFEPSAIFMKDIPIPKASESDQKAIEKLVQKCLDAKGVGVEKWEKEIDDRVAHLYGLTDEEMKIIRGDD